MSTTIDPTTLTAIAPPTLLATLKSARRDVYVRVYADGTLAYRFRSNPDKWIHSRISVYSGVKRGMVGYGENLTPEQFIERHLGLGYVRGEQQC